MSIFSENEQYYGQYVDTGYGYSNQEDVDEETVPEYSFTDQMDEETTTTTTTTTALNDPMYEEGFGYYEEVIGYVPKPFEKLVDSGYPSYSTYVLQSGYFTEEQIVRMAAEDLFGCGSGL